MVHLALPKQPLQVLARLQAGPQMMIPMNIDTVVIDFTTLTLNIVRRALIPADLDVRKLELGTWEQGEYSDMAIPVLGSQPRQPQTI
jgi:hypothetical protein